MNLNGVQVSISHAWQAAYMADTTVKVGEGWLEKPRHHRSVFLFNSFGTQMAGADWKHVSEMLRTILIAKSNNQQLGSVLDGIIVQIALVRERKSGKFI